MDTWLNDRIKEILFQPCLLASGYVGRWLEHRLSLGESVKETTLTDLFLERFDSNGYESAWGVAKKRLADHDIYLSQSVRNSKRENENGADLGLILRREVYTDRGTQSEYAALIQCKKVNEAGYVSDFFHQVKSSGAFQSRLLLDITPSSFYFVYIAPSLLRTYHSVEPMAFVSAGKGCSTPIWNMGCFESESACPPFLSSELKAQTCGIFVVPAMAVDAVRNKNGKVHLTDILPNALPLWYWFGELFCTGFVGDRRDKTLKIARNVIGQEAAADGIGVGASIEIRMGNG